MRLLLIGAIASLGWCAEGSLRGRLTDVTGAAITNARIRLIPEEATVVRYREWSNYEGRFAVEHIEAGPYRVAFSAPGFRERWKTVQVEDAKVVDLGAMSLEVAGCDAPGLICDYVTARGEPLPKPPTTGAVDLPNQLIDVTVETEGNKVYLQPLSDAQIAEPNSPGDCNAARYGTVRVRIDGLGPGSDVCVFNRKRAVWHLFFLMEIGPGARTPRVHYVTRSQ